MESLNSDLHAISSFQSDLDYFCQNNPQRKTQRDSHLPGDENITNLIQSLNQKLKHPIHFEKIYDFILPYLNNMTNKMIRFNAYVVLFVIIQMDLDFDPGTPAILVKWIQERMTNDVDCFEVLVMILKLVFHKWNLSDFEYRVLMQNIFENIPVQQLGVQERRLFFDVLEWIVEEHPKVCQLEFVIGYIQVIDGERDPLILSRNFKLVPKLVEVAGHQIDQNAAELFDIFSCYFPVNFNPPKKDPHGITRENLASSLLQTLAASPSFAEYAIPFFEEKISSSIVETKVESLLAVAYCIEKYGEEAIRLSLTELWATIRTEVLRSTQHEVHHAAIEAITRIARIVSNPSLDKEQCLSNLRSVLLPAVQEIRSPECKMAKQFSEMIASVAASSEWNCALVTEYIIPQIYDLFLEVKTSPKRSGILVIGMQILSTLVFFPNLREEQALASRKMLEIAFSLKDDYNLKNEIIEVMSRLMLFEDHLNHKEPSEYLVHALLQTNDTEKKLALECLEWVCNNGHREEDVKLKILQPILSSLKFNSEEKEIEKSLKASSNIALICPKIATICIDAYFSFLFEEIESRGEIIHGNLALPILKNCIEKCNCSISQSMRYIERIVGMVGNSQHIFDSNSLSDLSEVCRVIFSNFVLEDQKELAQNFLDALFDNQILLQRFGITISNFDPFTMNDGFLILVSKSLLYLKKELLSSKLLTCDFLLLSKKLLTYSITVSNVNYSEIVTHFLASVLNKLSLPIVQEILISYIIPSTKEYLEDHVTVKNISIFSWILKSIVMRPDCSNFSATINSNFQNLLLNPDKEISFAAARAYGIVMKEEVLNKSNDCNETIFFRQKFFLLNINSLLEKYTASEEKSQGALLEAVANLIQYLPSKVLIQHINQLYPLVQAALRGKDDIIIQSGLNTLLILLEEAEEFFLDRLEETIPILLELSHAKVRMAVRCTALRCLQTLATYPYAKIFPYQNTVIRGLRPAIDDHKRVVRKEAVIARNRWHVLNQ